MDLLNFSSLISDTKQMELGSKQCTGAFLGLPPSRETLGEGGLCVGGFHILPNERTYCCPVPSTRVVSSVAFVFPTRGTVLLIK